MAYDLKTIEMPRIHGKALRALAKLVETPGVRNAIRSKMLANLGFKEFRSAPVHGPVAFGPVIPSSDTPAVHPVSESALQEIAAREGPATGFAFETIQDFRNAYAQGTTTPLEVAQRWIDAVEESERATPAMKVFIASRRDDLLRQAEESARRHAEGKALSVLDGVPVPVKDEVDVVGYPTTVGTHFLGAQVVQSDATAVARLRGAGALLPGKANMHELGIGVTGINPHHGTARNPYDPTCFTGGSSSGSAAAVAAGFSPVALGADGGGSIRIPASLCGLVGLKPTFGRVSEWGAAPLCWSVAHLGPIAACARDASIAYAIMAGPDERDAHSCKQPPVDLDGVVEDDLKGFCFGVFRPWFEDADPPIVAACDHALRKLVDRGARIEGIDVEGLDTIRVAHLVTIVGEMAASQLCHVENRDAYALDTRINLALSGALTAVDYVHAQRHRREVCEQFQSILQRVDGVVTPSTACTAQPLSDAALAGGESDLTLLGRLMRFAPAANLTGLPAITFPVGYDERGMPIGMQVMGRPWEEHRLLRVAHVAESFLDRQSPRWHRRLLR